MIRVASATLVLYFQGDLRMGKKHGRGELKLSNGERYEGEWAMDEKHGNGEYCYLNGTRACSDASDCPNDIAI